MLTLHQSITDYIAIDPPEWALEKRLCLELLRRGLSKLNDIDQEWVLNIVDQMTNHEKTILQGDIKSEDLEPPYNLFN